MEQDEYSLPVQMKEYQQASNGDINKKKTTFGCCLRQHFVGFVLTGAMGFVCCDARMSVTLS